LTKVKFICKKCGAYKKYINKTKDNSWDWGFCVKCFNQMPMYEIIHYTESNLGITKNDLALYNDPTIRLKMTPVDMYWHELTIRYLRDNNYEIP